MQANPTASRSMLQQLGHPAEPELNANLVGGIIEAPVQRLAARVKLVAVAQAETPEVELRHPRKLPVTPHICTDAEGPFDKHQRRGFRLWPQAFGIRY